MAVVGVEIIITVPAIVDISLPRSRRVPIVSHDEIVEAVGIEVPRASQAVPKAIPGADDVAPGTSQTSQPKQFSIPVCID
jgi:hypothetical protein